MSNPNTISFSLRDSLQGMKEYASNKSTYDLIVARVTFVLLDDSNKEKFNKMGGWRAIGTIECIPFINFNDPTSDPIIARPLNSNITRYPVQNELVTLRTLVSKDAQNNLGNYKPEIYYDDIISVFNASEENAAPDRSFFKLNPNSKSVTGDYISTGGGKRLIKAPGDITVEGRRGGSLRLGSNASNFNTPWQAAKPNPILILSNNPFKVSESIARFEDVNRDGSVLVMMSGHNINFQAATDNFQSYDTSVVIPEIKNNIVVVDQTPKSQPTQSLQQEDAKPIPAETPATGSIPVSNPIPPSKVNNAVEDEEDLPEREDLMVIDIEFDEVPVALGTSRLFNVEDVLSDGDTFPKINLASLESLAKEYNISLKDLKIFIKMESAGRYEKATLYRKLNSNKGPGKKYINTPEPGYELAAVGLIQFTKPSLRCLGLRSLQDIIGTSYEYQVGLMRQYFACNSSQFRNADKYSLYAGIFYPILAKGGRIVKPDSFILGSEISDARAVEIGSSNPYINNGNKISVADFKRFVDKLFR